ncbi:coiled-coil domain-containing protein 27 [Kogia breviceps]|uniref:coiled-coil domain-containing protein 27 n=1 Tax=Kogia breviceps TaxID=27615 RepID=UPI002795AEB8|nr:coiled-coil domain-containing protein 27 [Kogia breviceps]
MSPIRASTPKKKSLGPSWMEKGLIVLRQVASRNEQTPEGKLRQKERSLSKSAQASNRYYGKTRDFNKDTSPQDSGFLSEMEKLWHQFLTRPGCPQFSTRSTSMTHHGSAMTLALSEDTCVSSETWKATEDLLSGQECGRDSPTPHPPPRLSTGCRLPFSNSACEFNHLRKKTESQVLSPAPSNPVLGQSYPRQWAPWYISVIHEEDRCLFALGKEVQRLSELEVQVQKKDEETLALQEEREALRKQLKCFLKSESQEASLSELMQERPSESAPKLQGRLSARRTFFRAEEEPENRQQLQGEQAVTARGKDLEGGSYEEEEGLEREAEQAAAAEEEGGMELEEEEEAAGMGRAASGGADTFEEELVAQLEGCKQLVQEVRFQLAVTRTRHCLATGATTSLQRQVEIQESRLQSFNTENQVLQKELWQRKQQLQAMSDKFSNLQEDKKHEEMMGLIEKDNLLLRQQVSELQKEVGKREQTISELEAKVSQLQAQVNQSQGQLQRRKQPREETQSKNEMIRPAEQQARVALESAQSRLERLRNKIIQATCNTMGFESLTNEISDNDILEALQRIISERTDYHNQLKQKGVKVPPLQRSEILPSPSKSKKIASK